MVDKPIPTGRVGGPRQLRKASRPFWRVLVEFDRVCNTAAACLVRIDVGRRHKIINAPSVHRLPIAAAASAAAVLDAAHVDGDVPRFDALHHPVVVGVLAPAVAHDEDDGDGEHEQDDRRQAADDDADVFVVEAATGLRRVENFGVVAIECRCGR